MGEKKNQNIFWMIFEFRYLYKDEIIIIYYWLLILEIKYFRNCFIQRIVQNACELGL